MTCAGICQSGYASSTAVTVLLGLHAVDVALVDVDFDLERAHVHDRADARAREAAAGRDRRDHLARLRVLRDRDAAERRADDRVVEVRALQVDLPFGDAHLLVGASMRAAIESTWACAVSRSATVFRRSAASFCARSRASCASASRTSFSRTLRRAASACASARASAAPELRIVEPREHLAFFDGHALLDVDFDHLAGDLRRHRRPAPRGDVARRIQDRGLGAGCALNDRCRLDFHRPRTVHVSPCAARSHGEHREQHNPLDPRPGPAFRRTLDFERSEFVFERWHLWASGLQADPRYCLRALRGSACVSARRRSRLDQRSKTDARRSAFPLGYFPFGSG